MSETSTELERLHADACKAAVQYPELKYLFVEANGNGFPVSIVEQFYPGEPHECLEAFDFGDHQAAHVILGESDAVAKLREISHRAISCTPLRFRYSYLGESGEPVPQWIHAILALDSAIGTGRFGGHLLWYDAKNADGETMSAVTSFGPLELSRERLIPDSLQAGLTRQGRELVKAARTLQIDRVFDASSVAVDQLIIRQDMPPYFDGLQPTYSQMVKLVWEIDDLTRAMDLAGLIDRENDIAPRTLGSEGDCGLMLAAMGVERLLNRARRPWSEIPGQMTGWSWAVFEAVGCLARLMAQLYEIYGWSRPDKSMPLDRAKIPRVPNFVYSELQSVAHILRRDGLEQLHRDANTLGSPKASAFREPTRVFVEQIDSFEKVKTIGRSAVEGLLNSYGVLDMYEDSVQLAFEQILGVPYHKRDWGGEENDLYATIVYLGGRRITAAFALNGKGKSQGVLQLSDCGKNGDQIVRLFQSPADLFVVQSVGLVAENLVPYSAT